MKREFVFPLIAGAIFGALIMIFWQFSARLNNATVGLAQLQQATTQNTKTITDVVAFINQATGADKTSTPTTPAE